MLVLAQAELLDQHLSEGAAERLAIEKMEKKNSLGFEPTTSWSRGMNSTTVLAKHAMIEEISHPFLQGCGQRILVHRKVPGSHPN